MQKKFSRKQKNSKRSYNNKKKTAKQYGGAGIATMALHSAKQPETIKALAELFPNITTIMKGVGDGVMTILKNHLEAAKSINAIIKLKNADPEHIKKLSEFIGKKLGGVIIASASATGVYTIKAIKEKIDPVFEKIENNVTKAQTRVQSMLAKKGTLNHNALLESSQFI